MQSNLLQIIKKICKEERQSSMPCDYILGTVTKADPLKIKISAKITLDEDFFDLTATAKKVKLAKGDQVAILQAQGGQKFLIIDKVVNA